MLPKIKSTDWNDTVKKFSDVRIIGLIAFGFVVLLVAWSSLKALEINYNLEKQIAGLEQRNRVQKLQNENLKLQNVYYESDEYLELTARRQLNKAAPGEKLYQVPRSVAMANTVSLPKTKKQIEQEKQSRKSRFSKNLEAWWGFFTHSDGN